MLCALFSIGQTLTSQNAPITPGGFFDRVYDKDGNVYNLADLNIKPTGGQGNINSPIASTCQAGFFIAHFANGSGMASTTNLFQIACRTTVCQVLENISGLLGWNLNGPWPSNAYVHILVDDITNYVPTASTSSVLGMASPFYAVPFNPFSGFPGIARNQMQKTIQSKVDAWTNVAMPLTLNGNGYYHGYMAFNFVNNGLIWNPDYTFQASATQIDLYTVILHEITHALGFASLIDANGISKLGPGNNYYTSYDDFLYTNNNVKLLSSNGCSSQYGLSYNTSTLNLQPACPCPTCYTTDMTNCNVACKYISTLIPNMPVYTPNCFEAPSSLSHFEDMCYPANTPTTNNNQYFTMSNANGAGVNKRFLRQEERNVLCDLGYTVGTTYTSAAVGASTIYSGGACAGPVVWGINDGIVAGAFTYTSSGGTVTISIAGANGIIANDYQGTNPVVTATCIESVYNNGTVSVAGNNIFFTPATSFAGSFLLRYIPLNANGNQGNITYIYGYVFPNGCTPISACDMVQNGGFESNLNCGMMGTATNIAISCWQPFNVDPELFVNGCTSYSVPCNLGVSTVSSNPTFSSHNMSTNPLNKSAVGLGGFSWNTSRQSECMMNFLGAPLIPNTAYNLSFWAYQYKGTKVEPVFNSNQIQNINQNNLPIVLSFATSNAPVVPLSASFPIASQETLVTTPLSSQMNTWQFYNFQFTYTPTSATNGNILYVGPNTIQNFSTFLASGQPTTGLHLYYMLIDDISLKAAAQSVSIALTTKTICAGNGFTNLAQYVSVPTGTFTGPGITTVTVNGNVQYNFNTPASLNPGVYTITYNYLDNIGCLQTTFVQITLINSNAAPVLSVGANSVCAGNTTTISAIGTFTSINWLPGNYTTNIITVPAGSGTTYTVLTALSPTCINFQTIEIPLTELLPQYQLVHSGPGVCSGVPTTFTLTGTPAIAAFTCNPGFFTSSPFTYAPVGTTQFTFSVLTTDGCTLTGNYAVVTKTDCCTGTSTVINSIASNSITNLSGSNQVNFPIQIAPNSTLNVSGELKLAAGVFINVQGVLNLNSAHLYACGTDMWEGIRLASGSVFNSEPAAVSNLIEDAKVAITNAEVPWNGQPPTSAYSGTWQPATCKISNTVFNKNYIGIYIDNIPLATTTNYNFSLKSSVFTCRNVFYNTTQWAQSSTLSGGLRFQTGQAATILSSPYLLANYPVTNLKAPYSNMRSYAGIQLLRVGITTSANAVYSIVVGDASGTTVNFNIFDSHAIGIDAQNTHLASFNNVFQNTQYQAAAGINAGIKHVNNLNLPGNTGQNLWLHNAKLDLVSPSNPTSCNNKFYNCNNGVYAAGTSTLNIKHALFSSSQSAATPISPAMPGYFGVNIISNKFDNYQIHSNNFLNMFAGINCAVKFDYISYSTNAAVYGERWGTFSCTANYFSSESAPSASVGNGRTALGIGISAPITSQANQFTSFYSVVPLNGLKIMYNNFDRVACGISMSNLQVKAYTKTFANNTILLSAGSNPNWAQWGVKSSANYKSIVNTNTVIGFSTANTLNVAGILHEDNLTGASAQCNNVSNLPRGFEHKNKNPYMVWRENRMAQCWHGMHATNWGTFAVSSASVGMGIGPQGSLSNKSGNQWLGTTWSLSNPQTWVDANSYANSSPLWSMNSGSEWLNPLYQGMQGIQPAFSYQNPVNTPSTNTGISICPSTSGGCLNCSARGGSEEYDLDSEIANLLLFISIDLDSLIALNNDTLDAWYADLEDQIGDLFKIESYLAQGDFSTAQSYINAFTPETNVQENFKSYFQLYRKFAEYDSLNGYDSLSLFVLANQCPAVDGPAIHKARSLYDLIYGGLSFYNDDSCETNGYTGARNGKVVEELAGFQTLIAHENRQIKGRLRNHYSLFPNPASTKITISSSNYKGAATVSIFDVSGHILFTKSASFENNQTVLEFDLANGIYFVRINDQANGTTSKKLIINR